MNQKAKDFIKSNTLDLESNNRMDSTGYVQYAVSAAKAYGAIKIAEDALKSKAIVLSDDIRDCTCSSDNDDLTFAQFERESYNRELEKRNAIIKELRADNKYLRSELKRYVTLLGKRKK